MHMREVLQMTRRCSKCVKKAQHWGHCSVHDDWTGVHRGLYPESHTGSEKGLREQLKDVKQEMFSGSSLYIRVEPVVKGRHLRSYSRDLENHNREIKY